MFAAETLRLTTDDALALDAAEAEARAAEATAGRAAKPRGDADPAVLRLLGSEAAAELAGRVSTGRELARREAERRQDAFATGVAPLDRLLDGGLPRGELVEMVGCPGSGRFAATLALLARATTSGEAAVLVDLGDHLTPEIATAAGVDVERLLWLRPETSRDALAAAEISLNGGFPLVVVDLGTPPVAGGRGAEGAWMRLARAAQDHGAALLVASPYRVSGTTAHSVVTARRGRAVYAAATTPRNEAAPKAASRRGATTSPLLIGLAARWTLEKARGRRGGEREAVQLTLPGTFPLATPSQSATPPPPVDTDRRRPARRAPRRAGVGLPSPAPVALLPHPPAASDGGTATAPAGA